MANLNDFQEQLDILNATKTSIKEAIISKGQDVSSEDSFSSYADKIDDIVTLEEGTADANANADDILLDKTAYVNGQKVTGTLEIADAVSINNSDNTDTNLMLMNIDDIPSVVVGADINDLYGVKKVVEDGVGLEIIAPQSQFADVIGLTANKIKSGEIILGVQGTYAGQIAPSDIIGAKLYKSLTFNNNLSTYSVDEASKLSNMDFTNSYSRIIHFAEQDSDVNGFPKTHNINFNSVTEISFVSIEDAYEQLYEYFYFDTTYTSAYMTLAQQVEPSLVTSFMSHFPNETTSSIQALSGWYRADIITKHYPSDTTYNLVALQNAPQFNNILINYMDNESISDRMSGERAEETTFVNKNDIFDSISFTEYDLDNSSTDLDDYNTSNYRLVWYRISGTSVYESVAYMNADINNIREGQVVKVDDGTIEEYYIKDTTMIRLFKETELPVNQQEYQRDISLADEILGNTNNQ